VSLPPAKVGQWEKKFGTRPYTARPGKYHSHGMLAAQRFVAEKLACELALSNEGATVVDVGAAPHRTWNRLGARGWYMMPRVLPGDSARIARAPPASHDRICHCTVESCQHGGASVALLMVHSGYYVDPARFWLLLNDQRVCDCLVVEHPFTDVAGGFYDEADWYFDTKLIRMTVKGQEQTPYVHPLPPWSSGWRGVGGEAFHAEVLEDWDGVTRVVRVTAITDPRPPAEPLMWGMVSAEDNLAGPVQFSSGAKASLADNAKLGHITFDLDRIYKLGPMLYTTSVVRGEEVRLIVPINGVSRAAAHVANRPRTPELYQELSYVVRGFYNRSRLPAAMQAPTIAAVTALGFVANMGVEMDLVHTVVTRFSWRMTALSTLLGFGQLVVRRWLWLVGFLFGLTGVVTAVDLLDDHGDVDVAFTVSAFLFVALGFCCVCTVLPAHRTFQRWRERAWVTALADSDGPTAPLLGNAFPLTRNLPIPGSRYVRPPASEVVGSLQVGLSRESVIPKTGTIVSGIVIDGLMPTALDATQEAELSAVTNRVLLKRENPTPEALEELNKTFADRSMFPSVQLDLSNAGLNNWLASLKKRYPADYVSKMKDLWEKYQGKNPVIAPTRSFLKIEKSASTVKIDGAKAVKPRLIQPPSDESKAVLGPVISQLQKAYSTFWDGREQPIMYCSGYTNSAVGERVDEFIARCGGEGNVIAWSMDMETYDATLSFPLQMSAFVQYSRLGLPQWARLWLLATRPRGQTPNGVVYAPRRVWEFTKEQREYGLTLLKLLERYEFKVSLYITNEETGETIIEAEDFQMVSGRSDTNLTDSVVLAHVVVTPLRGKMIPYLLLICGDDGFLMTSIDHGYIFDEVKAFAKNCGLRPTGVVSRNRSDWEFCSRLFFWGIHPKTGKEQTVLGAKPFRGMARMGVNTTLPGAQNAAAAALSVRIDAGHVPFLSVFAERTYELCRDNRIRATGRPEWSAFTSESFRWLCSPRNYLITQERYNLGREHEEELQRLLGNLDRVPCTISWEPAVDATRVDEA